jgi:energy-coupling factor transporter ATP-binding protein EcfA2
VSVSAYSAYGLTFLSDFECPELFSVSADSGIRLRLGGCDASGANGTLETLRGGSSSFFHFSVDGVARYCVCQGNEIAIEPSPQFNWQSLRLFLLSAPLGALLHQRTVPVLHGSSVATPRGAVILTGPSASGKSTLAAGLLQRGHRILTDEIAAVEIADEVTVLPGPTSLMVWRDALRELAIAPAALTAVRPELEKYFLPLGSRYESRPSALRKIYVLEASGQAEPSLVPLRAFEKYKALAANIYRPGVVLAMGIEGLVQRRIAELAAKTEVALLTRPLYSSGVERVLDILERDLA